MSPYAEAEIQRSTQAAWTFADFTDSVVAVVCAAGVIFLVGMWVGADRATSAMRTCLQALDDGRSLHSFAITPEGHHAKCSYESIRSRVKR